MHRKSDCFTEVTEATRNRPGSLDCYAEERFSVPDRSSAELSDIAGVR